MKHAAAAVVSLAFVLFTFFQFPGHTWLQQDSQIYVAILEHQWDPAVLRNDILVQQPHVAYTIYDEVALALRRVTGLGIRPLLEGQQILTRAFGVWGLYLIATALGLPLAGAVTAAMVVSLGAMIAGPQVLTFEYEPTPRAFAVPLLMWAAGLAAHRRSVWASIAAGAAFLYHPPTALPVWAMLAVLIVMRRDWRAAVPLFVAAAMIAVAASRQSGGTQILFGRLTPLEVQLQHLRTAYVWISTWPWRVIAEHIARFAIAMAAFWRIRHKVGIELRLFLVALPLAGLLSMPVSWLLLERAGLAIVPQIQPLRLLLFGTLAMQILTAVAGLNAVFPESFLWMAAAYYPSLQSWWVLPLALATALLPKFSPAVAALAFFVVPPNYPHLHTPALADLSAWAQANTRGDSVFVFPNVGRGLDSGIFRAEGLRAVYVDWKGGGQINYLRDFAEVWWPRWQQVTVAHDYSGNDYVVMRTPDRLPGSPVFENPGYAVWSVK